MTDRICSWCGELYTDEKGHDYRKCYSLLEAKVNVLTEELKAMSEAKDRCSFFLEYLDYSAEANRKRAEERKN